MRPSVFVVDMAIIQHPLVDIFLDRSIVFLDLISHSITCYRKYVQIGVIYIKSFYKSFIPLNHLCCFSVHS